MLSKPFTVFTIITTYRYRIAADQGYAKAQNNLGSLYYNGKGVPQDFGIAVDWFMKSSHQGNPNAMNNLGICYEEGRGVPQDAGMSIMMYKQASEKGNANATNNLGYMYLLQVKIWNKWFPIINKLN